MKSCLSSTSIARFSKKSKIIKEKKVTIWYPLLKNPKKYEIIKVCFIKMIAQQVCKARVSV